MLEERSFTSRRLRPPEITTCSFGRIASPPASIAARMSAGNVLVQLEQLRLHLRAELVELEAAVVLVHVIGRFHELRGRVGPVGDEHAVLHVAVARDDDEEDAPIGEPEELDVAQHRAAPPRRDDRRPRSA
jgi:hypothetical protein